MSNNEKHPLADHVLTESESQALLDKAKSELAKKIPKYDYVSIGETLLNDGTVSVRVTFSIDASDIVSPQR